MSIFSYTGKICNMLANAESKLQNSYLWKIFIEKKSERFYTKMYVVVIQTHGFISDFHFFLYKSMYSLDSL